MNHPEPNRHVTLRQIAEAVGVSHTAVSLALRNDPSVSPATRARIRKTATKLGYRPDPFVAALLSRVRTGRTPKLRAKLAFVNPHIDVGAWKASWTNAKFHAGAKARAAELGFEVDDFHAEAEGISYERLSSILWSRGIRGVVLGVWPVRHGTMEMKWERFAAASQGYSLGKPELHRSCHFHWDGMIQVCVSLRLLGYRRPGLALTQEASTRVRHLWLGAFQSFHAARGIVCLPPYLDPAGEIEPKAFLKWRKAHSPDVIITVHPEIASWLESACLKVPKDIGLAHLDRHEEIDAGWAGIDQNARAVGARAVELVVEQLRNNEYGIPEQPKVVLTRGAWVQSRSVRRQSLTGLR